MTQTGDIEVRAQTGRLLIASSDGHAGMPVSSYREYFEQRYWPALDELVVNEAASIRAVAEMIQLPQDVLDLIDSANAIRTGGCRGAWDIDIRLREMDREGVAWELLYMGAGDGTTLVQGPFVWEASRPYPAELRAAGARAYNRWLADHIAAGHGRLGGVALVGPCHDLDAEVRELEWLAAHGFVAVCAPGTPADPSLPLLNDPYFEPFWAACETLGLRIAMHVNWGVPQEDRFTSQSAAYLESKKRGEVFSPLQMKERLVAEGLFYDSDTPPRRAIWQLMLGGVFDRHPGLGAMLTELRSDWTPDFIAHLDVRFERGDLPMKRRPSEYWQENFRLVPSFVHRVEIEMRDEIGIRRMLYGRDYPHPEGTWPNTHDWLRDALAGVSESDARLFLGENAIEWFSLDREALRDIASRIGPSPDDILGGHTVDPRYLEQFHIRGGYQKPRAVIDVAGLDRFLDEDLDKISAG
jgi:predicted TIM-barrel fold metal-dependent hydrolase